MILRFKCFSRCKIKTALNEVPIRYIFWYQTTVHIKSKTEKCYSLFSYEYIISVLCLLADII